MVCLSGPSVIHIYSAAARRLRSNKMRPFFEDLKKLEDMLCDMASLVRASIHKSVLCLTERDEIYGDQVMRDEALVNQLEIQIDDLATRLVALNQPVAGDMRLIVAALKINTDLERMGDLAVSIVQRSLPVLALAELEPEVPITQMATAVENMVAKCLSAFIRRDGDEARSVLNDDDEVDAMRTDIYNDLIRRMEKDSAMVRPALGRLFVVRNLERIADHATNIAEDVIFLARGIDVRHRRETDIPV